MRFMIATVFLLSAINGIQAADLSSAPKEPPPPEQAYWYSGITLGVEGAPEFAARNNGTSKAKSTFQTNDYEDAYWKLSISRPIYDNFSVTFYGQQYYKDGGRTVNGKKGSDSKVTNYLEGQIAYKFQIDDRMSLTPAFGLGGIGSSTGIQKRGKGNYGATYYAVYLNGDYKINDQWTWNAFSLRWRNAFGYTWITPKAGTGVTYRITPKDAISFNFSYAWKQIDTSSKPYSGLAENNYTLSLGYKHTF